MQPSSKLKSQARSQASKSVGNFLVIFAKCVKFINPALREQYWSVWGGSRFVWKVAVLISYNYRPRFIRKTSVGKMWTSFCMESCKSLISCNHRGSVLRARRKYRREIYIVIIFLFAVSFVKPNKVETV